jgi:hypothetical protein
MGFIFRLQSNAPDGVRKKYTSGRKYSETEFLKFPEGDRKHFKASWSEPKAVNPPEYAPKVKKASGKKDGEKKGDDK